MKCTRSHMIRNIAPPLGCAGARGSGFHCTRRINWRQHKKSGLPQGKIEVLSKLAAGEAAIPKNANTSSPAGDTDATVARAFLRTEKLALLPILIVGFPLSDAGSAPGRLSSPILNVEHRSRVSRPPVHHVRGQAGYLSFGA